MLRFPHLAEALFTSLNYESIKDCKGVSYVADHGTIIWMGRKYFNLEVFKLWLKYFISRVLLIQDSKFKTERKFQVQNCHVNC